MEKIKDYYYLTKPGIIRGNLLTAAAGYVLASGSDFDIILFVIFLISVSLTIASACVFNNVLDINIDNKMDRTQKRGLVTGKIQIPQALVYGFTLGLSGLVSLWIFVNPLTSILGLTAIFSYVLLYGWAKRTTYFGTLVGTIPGAASLVAGYTAVFNRLDIVTLLLFLVMVTWQMPHFYAISIFRMREYKKANIPILPLVKGINRTKKEILIYMLLFLFSLILLTLYSDLSLIFLVLMLTGTGYWIYKTLAGYKMLDENKWARQVFGYSLIILPLLLVAITLDVII